MDLLYKEFQQIIALLLYVEDKELEEIQQIVTSIKARLMTKQATGILAKDIAIFLKFKFDLKPQQNRNNDKCFYYNKKRHYARNCNKQKNEERNTNN